MTFLLVLAITAAVAALLIVLGFVAIAIIDRWAAWQSTPPEPNGTVETITRMRTRLRAYWEHHDFVQDPWVRGYLAHETLMMMEIDLTNWELGLVSDPGDLPF